MTYIPEESKAIYQSKDGKEEKIFDALEWLAAMCLMSQTRESKWSELLVRVTRGFEQR